MLNALYLPLTNFDFSDFPPLKLLFSQTHISNLCFSMVFRMTKFKSHFIFVYGIRDTCHCGERKNVDETNNSKMKGSMNKCNIFFFFAGTF